ncbi:MAG: DNA mismatch repair endonuclease MutL [Oscillospiraceae bacterium]|jgi:DNA mismatch repair protein MutL|nr:DNA mismatch repair endonuclease MutL [Oscillospiraceae bacterium]
MSKIIQLSAHLADLIAAGEVVERPASVVKELFENAVDAGATAVTVEIKNGGLTLIRVVDNGSGIASDDVARAFLRHATSKIATEADLEAIGTLGFRGEALAAISSVSRVELETRTEDESDGTRAVLDGGDIISIEPAARPRGTTISVRDLFFNTPARQKFMKTDRAEAAAVLQTVIRLALSRPDITVRYIRDGEEELRTPGDGSTEACVYSALGREFSAGMLPLTLENEGVTARGFISKVEALRGNRNYQFFFVNGRCIRSKTLQAALEQAYRNRMFTGRFPSCVIYLETGASRLDVNVHPSKTEIKFLFEKHVFDAVHYGALSALDGTETPRETAYHPPVERGTDFAVKSPVVGTYRPAPRDVNRGLRYEPPAAPSPRFYPEPDAQVAIETPKTPDFRVVGEAMRTYIIVESGETLWLIDKHAAHERVHFDRLRSESPNPMPQSLLEPIIITPEDAETLLDSAELLTSLGFEVEDFGGGKLAVRQIPSDIEPAETESVLSEICTELGRGGDFSARRDEILASVACKAAIKSGKNSGEQELYELAGRVMRGEVRFCPHGRPVAVDITKTFIDKNFKRI